MTQASVIEVLLPIWQSVLQRSSVGLNDNFFDLGGTASSASGLFDEIARIFGRDLPSVLIYVAPTIEMLGALLEDPAPPCVPSILPMKPGAEEPPIFIAHGMGHTVLELSGLVGKISSRHSIYGMQARGIDGIDAPLATIEEMAQFHLEAIRELQAHGPYFLIGYSLGGLVTLEIAQQLCASGEKIALLVLMDSYPDKSQISVSQRALLSFRLTKRRAWSLLRSVPNSSRPQNTDDIRHATRRVAQRMRHSADLALRRYRPRYYPGRIQFLKAGIGTYFPDDPTTVWAHLAEQFNVVTVPGDHVGILTTECETLASVLSRFLDEAGR